MVVFSNFFFLADVAVVRQDLSSIIWLSLSNWGRLCLLSIFSHQVFKLWLLLDVVAAYPWPPKVMALDVFGNFLISDPDDRSDFSHVDLDLI